MGRDMRQKSLISHMKKTLATVHLDAGEQLDAIVEVEKFWELGDTKPKRQRDQKMSRSLAVVKKRPQWKPGCCFH